MTASTEKKVVRVPFVCPVCTAPNRVNLIELTRAGGMSCEACGKRLRMTDVMRAMHAPRKPAHAG